MFGLLPGFPINWRDGKQSDWFRALLFSTILAVGILAALKTQYLSCGLITGLFLLVIWHQSREKFRFYRVFMEDFSESMEMVESILIFKGIPFERKKNRFYVEDVEIALKTYSLRTAGDFGTYISIRSQSRSAKPLIDSLMQKIDETFLFTV